MNTVRLAESYLLFDFGELYNRRRPDELQAELDRLGRWCGQNGITFEARALYGNGVSLMHDKAVCLWQSLGGETADGCLLVTSANATHRGYGIGPKGGIRAGNGEMSYHSRKSTEIRTFCTLFDTMWESWTRAFDDRVALAEEQTFRYALLASGVFLHKWGARLRSGAAIRYHLSAEGRRRFTGELDEDMRDLGFERPTATTLARQPLRAFFDRHAIRYRVPPRGFGRNYTIETNHGRWCPRSVWKQVEDHVGRQPWVQDFIEAFHAATKPPVLEGLRSEEEKVEQRLLDDGLIVEDEGRFDDWLERIRLLRGDETQLLRNVLAMESFALPYDRSEREMIDAIFDSLSASINSRQRQNQVSTKVLAADDMRDPVCLELTDEEVQKLLDLLSRLEPPGEDEDGDGDGDED